MTWNARKALLGSVVTLMILLACFALGLIPLNLFFLKTTISDFVRDRTGAELIVEGPLRLQLGWQPKLTARDVEVHWPDELHSLSASIRDFTVQTRMPSVWRGDIDLQALTARDIVIDAKSFGLGDRLPDKLQVKGAAPLNESMRLSLEGRVRNENWALRLNGANLDSLLNATTEYPLAVSLDLPGSGLEFDGSILSPWETPGASGRLVVQSRDLSSLLSQLGRDVTGLGPLYLQSGIALDETVVELDGLEGTLGDLSFALSAILRDWSSRPWVEITANIPEVDPSRLPGTDGGTADSDPSAPLDLKPVFDQLAGFDGRVDLTVNRVRHDDFPLRDLAVSAVLDRGVLTVSDARATVSGIDVSAQAVLDTTAECARLETSIRVPEIDLSTLSDLTQTDIGLEGRLDNGQLKTVSCGVIARNHLQRLETALQVDRLVLSDADDQPPLDFRNIELDLNWQDGGRISFESEFLGEPLSLAAEFGSVEQVLSDQLWPIALEARTNTVELELDGQTNAHETGLILDLSLKARLGNSDVSGEIDWSGLGSGRPLKADLRSTLLDLEDLAILYPDDDAGGEADDTGSVEDWSELLDQTELLGHWHEVPSIDVNLSVGQLEGTPYEINSIGLDAHLEDRQLEDGRMQLDFEGIAMKGLLNVDMREPSALLDYHVNLKNVDIGRLMKAMELSDTVDAHVEQADVRLESNGSTLRELGQNMIINSVLNSLRWSFEAGPKNRPFDVNLSEVKVQAFPEKDAIWETEGTLNGFPLDAWLRTPNLRDAFNDNAPLPLRFIVDSRSEITMLDLVVYPESENGFKSKIQVSGQYSSDEDIDLSTLPSPLEDYSFGTELTFRKNEYLASDIEARIGSSDATGRFSIEPSSEGFRFDLDASSSFIETDDLVLWVQEFREMREFIAAKEVADAEEAPMPVGLATMIDEYFNEFIGDNTWDVDINVSELRSGGNLLGEMQFGLHMDGDEIILDPAVIRLPGGNVSVKYSSIQNNSHWDYNLDVHVERLEYGGLLRLFDPESAGGGEIHVDTSLHSRSDNVEEIVNHLEGTVDMAVFPDDVGAEFLDLWASNLVLALLRLGDDQQKKLNCMVARFEVENGVMTSKETFLDSTDIIVRARGEIDLANRRLDLLAAPQAKMEKFLSISTPMEVTGPFDDFSVGVAKGSFLMTLVRWYYGLIYVPFKWLTGERFPKDGIATCFNAMDWEVPTEAR